MGSLIQEHALDRDIEAWRFDGLPVRYPVAGEFAFSLLDRLVSLGDCSEYIDYITGETGVATKTNISDAVDTLYIVSDEGQSWLYIYNSDLDWGIGMSTNPIPDFFGPPAAKSEFVEYLKARLAAPTYYRVEKLLVWAQLADLREFGGA